MHADLWHGFLPLIPFKRARILFFFLLIVTGVMSLHDRRRPLTWRQPSKRLPQETSLDTLSFDFGYGILRKPWPMTPCHPPGPLVSTAAHVVKLAVGTPNSTGRTGAGVQMNPFILFVFLRCVCVFVVTNQNFVRRATATRRALGSATLPLSLGRPALYMVCRKYTGCFGCPQTRHPPTKDFPLAPV